jgi:DNA repair exonuclease SbcCD nuclease subunit
MRFSFIHAADLHIDSPLIGLSFKDQAVAARFSQAGRRAVEALVNEVITSKAAFLIIAGDVFDGDWKDVATGLFFVRAISELHRQGIPAFMVRGNHDADSLMSRDLPYPDSVKQFSSGKAETFTLEDYKVALHGRSFPTRLITADFVSAYSMRRDGWLNIGVLHTSLDGSRGHEGYAPCTVDDLKRYGYDYWALGHVHAAEIISRDPWIVFPGNLQGRNPRETGAKGAVRVTVEDGRIVDVTPLVLDGARWNHLSVDVSDGATERDMFDRIKSALEAAQVESGGRPLAARITLTGTTPLHNKLIAQHDELLDELRAAGFQAASDCWVEQVKIKTSAPALTAFRATDAESIDVEDLLSAAATDQQFAAELTNLVTTVADKMPKDLRDEFIQSEAVTTLAADARAMLLGRLS